MTDWLRAEGYSPVNDLETIWMFRNAGGILVHAIYADDFLHFSSNPELYSEFKSKIRQRFDIKTGDVDSYLGNKISVDSCGNIKIDQVEYLSETLKKFEMENCTPVKTPMEERLTESNRGKTLSKEEQAKYRMIVGSLLCLSCWTQPNIFST